MNQDRRSFLEATVAGAAALTFLPSGLPALPGDVVPVPEQGAAFDFGWPARVTGKHKTCFDCAEPESGYGVWRANAWRSQYAEFMKVPPSDLSMVLILRHNAIALAMQQKVWDRYGLGKHYKVTHPLTMEATDKNPALLDEKDGIPAPFNTSSLTKQLAAGIVCLACNLALQEVVDIIKSANKSSDEAARREAVAGLVPGVILQPSGVFAAARAQEAGCTYVKAS